MSFKTVTLTALRALIKNVDLKVSSEGSTGDGKHEVEVTSQLTKFGFTVIANHVNGVLIMDKKTHTPKQDVVVDVPDGLYQIPQPYMVGSRGSFNPAPDMYIMCIQNKKVDEYIGIECKSSCGLKPTWNDKLPRSFALGNIIYLFTGKNKEGSHTCLFTGEIFFRGKDPCKIDKMYEDTRLFMKEQWDEEEFPWLNAEFRRKCEQKRAFTLAEMDEFNTKTLEFLEGVERFDRR